MTDEIEAWFGAAGPPAEELRRVDDLVMAAAPGIDRQLVPVGSGTMLGYRLTTLVRDAFAATDAGENGFTAS